MINGCVCKWGERFFKNLDPAKEYRGFDGIPDGKEGTEGGRLAERLKVLKERIERNIPSKKKIPFKFDPHCPPKTWEDMEVKPDKSYLECGKKYGMWNRNNKDGTLILMRHMYYELTLKYVTYFESYFSGISKDGEADIRRYFFWLIDANEAPFVYAILKSSMFKAWCKLTANTDKGQRHLTVGMWDTFPLPVLTESAKVNITEAGRQLFQTKSSSQAQWVLDYLVDGLFVSHTLLDDIRRKQILMEGFEAAHKNIETEMQYLVSIGKKPEDIH